MGNRSNYPEWVEKHRSKNREIKKIGDNYYLYKRSTVYDPATKRSRKVSGEYIGKITENGIVKVRKRQEPDYICAEYPLSFGLPILLEVQGCRLLQALKNQYREEVAETLFILTKGEMCERYYPGIVKYDYQNSCDVIMHPNIIVESNKLFDTLKIVGMNETARNKVVNELQGNHTLSNLYFQLYAIPNNDPNIRAAMRYLQDFANMLISELKEGMHANDGTGRYELDDVIEIMQGILIQRINGKWHVLIRKDIDVSELALLYPDTMRKIMHPEELSLPDQEESED